MSPAKKNGWIRGFINKILPTFQELGGLVSHMILEMQYVSMAHGWPQLNGLDDKNCFQSFASGLVLLTPSVFWQVKRAQGCGTQQKVVCTSMPLLRISVEGFVM